VSTPPSVLRIWLPAMFGAMVCLFLSNMSPVYWLLVLPLLPLLIFIVALAEVHDEGRQIHVRRLWKSIYIPQEDIKKTSESFLDGIGVLHLRRFVFPIGRIYFVHEWSTRGPEKENSPIWGVLASAAMAISGFIAARAVNIPGFGFETPHARILAFVFAGALCVLFVATRRKKSGFANCMLFAAAYIVGLVRIW